MAWLTGSCWAARVIELPIDQDEAFDDEPHMRGGARRDFDGRRPQPVAQCRGVDPTNAMLFQHSGERRLANALARARSGQIPPQVERQRRRDVVVNRVKELRVIAPELLAHPVR